jgi:UDP-N-acetyl-2-amino-2-deoxyglucuronate dehydrogenase
MIKVGFIGAGRIATAHLNAIKELKYIFLPVAVTDPIDENATHIASEFGLLHTYRNYHDMLDKEKLDLAVVAAPNGLHYHISKNVLENGMNILVEKPLALSYREAEELVEIANSKKSFLGVVLQKRLLPLYKNLKLAIDEGRFGKIFLIHLSLRWSRSKSYFANSWRGTREMDGGLVFNQASHDIDILGYLFSISEIFAYGGTFIHKIETEDNVVGVFKTDAGTIGNFEFTISLNNKNMGEIIEVFGENGRFIYGTGEYENLTTIPPFLDLSEKDLSFAREPTLSGKAHKLVYREVSNAVNGSYNSVINGKNTLHSILIEEGILASMRSNEKVFLKGVEK